MGGPGVGQGRVGWAGYRWMITAGNEGALVLSGPAAATGRLKGMEEAPAVWMFHGETMPTVLFYIFSFFSQNLEGNTETLNTEVSRIPLEEQEQLYTNVVPRRQRAAQ